MTLTDEAKAIRNEVQQLKPGRGRKFTKAMRRRILDWYERAKESGMLLGEVPRLLGVKLQKIEAWREAELRLAATVVPPPEIPKAMEATRLLPVSIEDNFPFGPGVTFVTPSGYRIMGLTLGQAIDLLRTWA